MLATDSASHDKGSLLIDFDPPQFLLNNESVDRIVDEFTKQEQAKDEYKIAKERAISIGISFVVSVFCSFESVFGNIPDKTNAIAFVFYIGRVLAIAGILGWLIICGMHCFRSKNKVSRSPIDIRLEMKASAKESINYTAILIIATEEKETQRKKLFVDKRGKSDHAFFLPYCSMDKKNTIQYQSERIKASLNDRYGLEKQDILDIVDLSKEPEFSIKSTRSGSTEEQHAFAFFRVCLMPSAKKIFDELEFEYHDFMSDYRSPWVFNKILQKP